MAEAGKGSEAGAMASISGYQSSSDEEMTDADAEQLLKGELQHSNKDQPPVQQDQDKSEVDQTSEERREEAGSTEVCVEV